MQVVRVLRFGKHERQIAGPPRSLGLERGLMPGANRDPLLLSLAAGDEQAFAALFDRYGRRLYRTALAMSGCREDAEDAVQDLFAALVRGRKRLAGVDDLEAYLFVSLRRMTARQVARRNRRPGNRSPVDLDSSRHRGSGGVSLEDGEALRQAVRQLPPAQQDVIALKIHADLTFAQIAEILGVSINTAASRYRYALTKLRAQMETLE